MIQSTNSRWLAVAVLATLSVCLFHQVPALGSITIVPASQDVWSTGASTWNVTLHGQVSPYASAGYSSAFQDLQTALATQLPGWTVGNGGSILSGTLTVAHYDAWAQTSEGGATLDATYARAGSDPSLDNLQYVQLIYTSYPDTGKTSPYIDNGGTNGTLPFYYTSQLNSQQKNSANGTYRFYDSPSRPWPGNPPGSLAWDAVLFLASWDLLSTTFTVYDGVHWGFYFQQYFGPSGDSPGLGVLQADAATVPEPSGATIALTSIAGIAGVLVVRGLRRSKAH